MEEIICKRCGSTHYVKNGKIRGSQRYKCLDCGYNFKSGDNRGRIHPSLKALAILLYGSGKASYGMIARLLNVSRTTVLYWVRTIGSKLPEPPLDTEVDEIEIDEMWHYISKKNERYGFGEQLTIVTIKPSDGLLEIVMLIPLKSSMKK